MHDMIHDGTHKCMYELNIVNKLEYNFPSLRLGLIIHKAFLLTLKSISCLSQRNNTNIDEQDFDMKSTYLA
jgi:hypothetical protein